MCISICKIDTIGITIFINSNTILKTISLNLLQSKIKIKPPKFKFQTKLN